MGFKDSYPDFASIEGHIRRARLERSVAIAHVIAEFFDESARGLKKLARAFGAKRAGALPEWARHAPQAFPKLPSEG
jgi:hypothetical protein